MTLFVLCCLLFPSVSNQYLPGRLRRSFACCTNERRHKEMFVQSPEMGSHGWNDVFTGLQTCIHTVQTRNDSGGERETKSERSADSWGEREDFNTPWMQFSSSSSSEFVPEKRVSPSVWRALFTRSPRDLSVLSDGANSSLSVQK